MEHEGSGGSGGSSGLLQQILSLKLVPRVGNGTLCPNSTSLCSFPGTDPAPALCAPGRPAVGRAFSLESRRLAVLGLFPRRVPLPGPRAGSSIPPSCCFLALDPPTPNPRWGRGRRERPRVYPSVKAARPAPELVLVFGVSNDLDSDLISKEPWRRSSPPCLGRRVRLAPSVLAGFSALASRRRLLPARLRGSPNSHASSPGGCLPIACTSVQIHPLHQLLFLGNTF